MFGPLTKVLSLPKVPFFLRGISGQVIKSNWKCNVENLLACCQGVVGVGAGSSRRSLRSFPRVGLALFPASCFISTYFAREAQTYDNKLLRVSGGCSRYSIDSIPSVFICVCVCACVCLRLCFLHSLNTSPSFRVQCSEYAPFIVSGFYQIADGVNPGVADLARCEGSWSYSHMIYYQGSSLCRMGRYGFKGSAKEPQFPLCAHIWNLPHVLMYRCLHTHKFGTHDALPNISACQHTKDCIYMILYMYHVHVCMCIRA